MKSIINGGAASKVSACQPGSICTHWKGFSPTARGSHLPSFCSVCDIFFLYRTPAWTKHQGKGWWSSSLQLFLLISHDPQSIVFLVQWSYVQRLNTGPGLGRRFFFCFEACRLFAPKPRVSFLGFRWDHFSAVVLIVVDLPYKSAWWLFLKASEWWSLCVLWISIPF